ncbi:MAG TPA: beta-ketoacyl synthase N-terminal-like domain-containing protein [Myxococcales bacterium]|jgi:3-oxoacyl-[acyl-carrier-protein] synthase II
MRRAAIVGMSQVSAAGAGLDALRGALAGARAEPEWVACGADPADRVPVLRAHARGLEKLTDPRGLRRLDPFAQRVLHASLLALRGCPGEPVPPSRVGVLVATGRGPLVTTFTFLDETMDQRDGVAFPITFANSVNGAAAAAVSATLGLQGPMLTVTAAFSPFSEALDLALDWLDHGDADRVLLATGDEFHPVLGYALRRRGGCSPDGRIRALDLAQCSRVPGETFAAFVLDRADRAATRLATLSGPVRFRGALPAPDAEDSPLLLAAAGDSAEGAAYRTALGGRPAGAHGALWGWSPTADALQVVAAAVSLTDGWLPPTPDAQACSAGIEPLPARQLAWASGVRCAAAAPDGAGVVVELGR